MIEVQGRNQMCDREKLKALDECQKLTCLLGDYNSKVIRHDISNVCNSYGNFFALRGFEDFCL